MADRVVYGNSFSENGWRMVDTGSCRWIQVPGTNGRVSLQICDGQPLKILRAFAADYNAFVEPLRDEDSACWTATNSVGTSNHLSGTAMDLNWEGPNKSKFRLGISEQQAYPPPKDTAVRELLAFYEGMVFCGGSWSIRDWMHFQMGYNTYGPRNFNKVESFINRKIRSDGFSTFKRGPIAAKPIKDALAETVASAMGNSLPIERYRQLTPAVVQALKECGCSNENRISMWMAQIGHESGGLRYMEEIADGSAYEGRHDLGNTQTGDGRKFKGRGPIQVTGRSNYQKLSDWAYQKRLTPEPNFFINNPHQLSTDQYGFLGVVWYWTVARPQINSLCDSNDINAVTRAINGGLNGIEDRVNRWNRVKKLNLMPLVESPKPTEPTPPDMEDDFMSALSPDEQRALYNEIMKQRTSRSPLRHVGEGTIGNNQDIDSYMDANVHVLVVDLLARLGDPNTLNLLTEVANVDLNVHPDRKGGRDLAMAILENAKRLASGQPSPPSVSAQSYEPPPIVPQPIVVQAPPVVQQAPVIQAPPVTYVAPSPEILGEGLYSEVDNFRSLLREVTSTITQTVKGN